jgi:hypothetical protein
MYKFFFFLLLISLFACKKEGEPTDKILPEITLLGPPDGHVFLDGDTAKMIISVSDNDKVKSVTFFLRRSNDNFSPPPYTLYPDKKNYIVQVFNEAVTGSVSMTITCTVTVVDISGNSNTAIFRYKLRE